MAEIIERYKDHIRGTVTVYKCDGCGSPTKRLKTIPNRSVLCNACQKKKAEQYEKARKDALYYKGRAEAIDAVKKCLAILLIKSDDIDYSFCDGHWGLVFSVFAKEFGLKDSEIYEIEKELKND